MKKNIKKNSWNNSRAIYTHGPESMEMDLKNLLEQYNDKARKGQIKTIDGELEDIHEIDDTDLVFAIAALQSKLEIILEM